MYLSGIAYLKFFFYYFSFLLFEFLIHIFFIVVTWAFLVFCYPWKTVLGILIWLVNLNFLSHWLIAQMAARSLRNVRFWLIAKAWVRIPFSRDPMSLEKCPFELHINVKQGHVKEKYGVIYIINSSDFVGWVFRPALGCCSSSTCCVFSPALGCCSFHTHISNHDNKFTPSITLIT